MQSRSRYQGTCRRLVLAFDIGTTYSGISYSVLEPGEVPEIKGVARFPGDKSTPAMSKIPTVIYYDQEGKVRATGAETIPDAILQEAEDEHWVKVEWFKLHLRSTDAIKDVKNKLPPLASSKPVVEIFADFLRYMLDCASRYIRETHVNGSTLWESVSSEIAFVLSHPNDWEVKEQAEMRKAAIMAGLIPDTDAGYARVSFVTEGEASLHFAIENNVLSRSIKKGNGIVIVDAGGGTIDMSSYTSPTDAAINIYEEIAPSQCHFHGSIFVTKNARIFLKAHLENSRFIEDLENIVRRFDETIKIGFWTSEQTQHIRFGTTRDHDPRCNIRSGQLKLEGSVVAQFFEPSIECIVSAVLSLQKNSELDISHVVLVGGFSASNWLFKNVLTPLEKVGVNVSRPQNPVFSNKAVSDGAISFYLDHSVRARVSKFAYGVFCGTPFDPDDPEHRAREADKYVAPSGIERISHCFSIIIRKNTQIPEKKECRVHYIRESYERSGFSSISSTLFCYRGRNTRPTWKDIDTNNYTPLCKIVADLSHLPLSPMKNPEGETFYRVEYDIVLELGLTEMKAQIAWKETVRHS